MDRQEILDAIKDGLGDAQSDLFTDDVIDRITDAVVKKAVPATQPDDSDPVDVEALVADSFKAGAESGFEGKSIERIASAVKGGKTIEEAVADEQALVDDFKERFQQREDTMQNGIRKLGGNGQPTDQFSAKALSEQLYGKKGE